MGKSINRSRTSQLQKNEYKRLWDKRNAKRRATRRKADPRTVINKRRGDLKRKYGLTLEGYQQMFLRQQGRCAICRDIETAIDARTKQFRNMAVDHNHETGRNRELLCSRCNPAVGMMKDDPVRARAVADYLEKHHGEPPQ